MNISAENNQASLFFHQTFRFCAVRAENIEFPFYFVSLFSSRLVLKLFKGYLLKQGKGYRKKEDESAKGWKRFFLTKSQNSFPKSPRKKKQDVH